MSFKKNLAIATAVGALAAIAVPAMALENEFHGFYTFRTYLSNWNNAGAADQSVSQLRHNERANNYAEQRARIFYTGKASDDLKLVTAFEMDTRFGGVTNGKYTNSSDAGVLDGDGINFETKWAYLDFNAMKSLNIKTGLLPYKDGIKGLFIDADLPAVVFTGNLNPLTLTVGYSRFADFNQNNSGIALAGNHLGDKSTDLFITNATFAITKDIKVGADYFLLANYNSTRSPIQLHTLGVNADAKVGPVSVSGFAAMQMGNQKNFAGNNSINYHGYAMNATAKVAVGPGTVKVGGLYVSGDEGSDFQQNAWVGSGVQSFNETGLMLLVRNNATSGTTTTNEFVRRSITNIILANAGFDAKIGPKAYVNANVGMAWNAKNTGSAIDAKTGIRNATNYLGTEIALEGGYKVYDNLTASLQAAYLIAGGAYNGSAADNATAGATADPENPYTARIVLTYAF